jgi:hypothetical protein
MFQKIIKNNINTINPNNTNIIINIYINII